jgi:hypothetical protein
MSNTKIPLGLVKVASPCAASWDAMSGNEQARFCRQCAEYVYNFSEMTEDEIAALIKEKEGKVCVRLFLRSDGTMMTADCPVGIRADRSSAILRGMTAAVVLTLLNLLLPFGALDTMESVGGTFNPIKRVRQWLLAPRCVMGKMAPMQKRQP